MGRPYKVGLTGGIGSGKSLVSNLFANLGVTVIDADDIVRELTGPDSPVLKEVIDVFGRDIIDESGRLNRQKLRDLIFTDPDSKSRLEAILHPRVFESINSKSGNITSTYCVLSIPLLLETGSQDMVDTVLVVDCPVSLQVERVSRRDGLSSQAIQRIIASQFPREDRLKAADEVIVNDGDENKLSDQVMQYHLEYLNRAKKLS
jgi:dephospho-CoA kinase